MYAPQPTWDLESLLPGGVDGPAFPERLDDLRSRIAALSTRSTALGDLDPADAAWSKVPLALIAVGVELGELGSLAHCTLSADTRSVSARRAAAAVDEVESAAQRAWVPNEQGLAAAPEARREAYVALHALQEAAPFLRQLARDARLQLERPLQELMVELDREALHGWGQLYDLVSGDLQATVELPGEAPRTVGISEATLLRSDPDEATRRAGFRAANAAWHGARDVCALALTHLTGARQTRYDRLGIDELEPSLVSNRVSRGLLEALWTAADTARPALKRYLARKATLLGKERLDWSDLYAPLPVPDQAPIRWEQAQGMVVESFGEVNPELGDFARHALAWRWVEAETRDGKRQGAFCTPFPVSEQSRVFLTWADTVDATLTLAHELGHAYHNVVLFEAPRARRFLTRALAETASTFAETVLRDAALRHAESDALRLFVLDQQLQVGVVFLMNIRARFEFERRLFALRREGQFDPDVLSEAIVACEKAAYGDVLGSYDPLFWASKLHFYISHFGFYNWPYTFGYLFSGAVYSRAMQEGPSFWPTYRELLRRTGYEDTAVIGREVLGEDLADPAFWQRAISPLLADVEQFLAATDRA